jgi:chemotaxis response regulator CheB
LTAPRRRAYKSKVTRRDVVAIGASAGGIGALMELTGGLPHGLRVAVLVAVHGSPESPGFLPEVPSRAGPLPAAHVVGIILSGALKDGSHGLQIVKRCGVVVIVQHLSDALVPGMPLAAILRRARPRTD